MHLIITKDGREILLPCNDYIFKLIFGDERNAPILAAFLAAVLDLPKEDLAITIINSELRPETEDDKLGILDVCVKTRSGKIINIEIQIVKSKAFFERIIFYKSKLITSQIGKGDWYDYIKKTICIVITDFNLIESPMEERYHHVFRLYDPVDGAYFGDVEEVHTLELPKLPRKPDGTSLWGWGVFLGAKEEEELTMVKEKNAEIKDAVEQLYELSANDEVRLRYEARLKAWRDEQARLAYARDEGKAEGKAEERAGFLALLDQGLTIEQIRARLSS